MIIFERYPASQSSPEQKSLNYAAKKNMCHACPELCNFALPIQNFQMFKGLRGDSNDLRKLLKTNSELGTIWRQYEANPSKDSPGETIR